MATFYASFAFWYAMVMSFCGFVIFAIIEFRKLRSSKAGGGLESLPDVGDMANKFKDAGASASALACSVLFMLIGTAIALALDKVKINPFW
jgi:hypothetical protein